MVWYHCPVDRTSGPWRNDRIRNATKTPGSDLQMDQTEHRCRSRIGRGGIGRAFSSGVCVVDLDDESRQPVLCPGETRTGGNDSTNLEAAHDVSQRRLDARVSSFTES